ncbi:MAG TPA: DUF4097 family beta strand repeat-containing protein [Pyrinomonadaceae bacterium]|jgi:hypothetical protein|nr:DUF4097 family beta strand repeat-containing protein [Pyrinomonadaceae bacterium]
MRNSVTILIGGAVASLLALTQAAACYSQNRRAEGGDLRARDEMRKSFRLAPGARVEVSSIRGLVEVETAETDVAEVHVVRTARDAEELKQFKVVVEEEPQGLVIRGEQAERNSGSGMGPDVRHRVTLKLPRGVNLSVQSVGGDVKVGDLGGSLTVSSVGGLLTAGDVGGPVEVGGVSGAVSIGRAGQSVEIKSASGDVKVGLAVGSLDVTGVSGALSASVSKLGPRGVRVSSVSGHVELRFSGELNAELSADNVSGDLSIDLPNVTVKSRPNASAMRALIGRGGPTISINGVSRGVRLTQGS